MELEQAKTILLPIHASFGVLALIFGFIALLTKKEPGKHTRLGGIFVLLMLISIVISIPVIVLSKNIFLGGLGAVAFYLVIMGWRIGKIRPPAGAATSIDRGFVVISMLLFSGFIGFGIWVIIRGNWLGAAAAGIGYLGFSSCLAHHRFFKSPSEDPRNWMQHHGSTLGGAFIASMTAFTAAVLTNYFKQIPEFVIWLAPIFLLTPLIKKQVKRGRE